MANGRQTLLKTTCGNLVKSEAERKIDNWLFRHGWSTVYEPKVPFSDGSQLQPDWVLLPQNGICRPVIVEYWGLSVLRPNAAYWAKEAQPKYQRRRKRKEALYTTTPHYHYIGLQLPDLAQLDSTLGEALDALRCDAAEGCRCFPVQSEGD